MKEESYVLKLDKELLNNAEESREPSENESSNSFEDKGLTDHIEKHASTRELLKTSKGSTNQLLIDVPMSKV